MNKNFAIRSRKMQKKIREISLTFVLFRFIQVRKKYEILQKVCERKFSHFFAKVFVHWMETLVPTRLLVKLTVNKTLKK